MKINKKLDNLFDLWSKEPRFLDGNFFRDGIVNEDIFYKQKERILFIAKEPNHSDHTKALKDFRLEWNEGLPNYRIARQIAILAYGIQNDFPDYNEVKPSSDSLRSIAFMNIKKSAGANVSIYSEFEKYMSESNHLEFIKTQIEYINPTLILLGLTWKTLRNKIFPDYTWMDSGCGIEYATKNGCIIIDYYHPSSFIPPNVNYIFLKSVLEKIK